MTDVRQRLADYEYSYADPDGECAHDCDDHRGRQAPKAFAALRAVLELHAPEHEVLPECSHCFAEGDVDHVPWPCPTVQAIATALEAK